MEKIKSRWCRNYLEGNTNDDADDDLNETGGYNCNKSTNNFNHSNKHSSSHNNHQNYINNITHNINNISNHSSKHCVPVNFEPLTENLYLSKRKREHSKSRKHARSMVCDCNLSKEEKARGIMGCLNDCLNRMLMIECGSKCPLGDHCLNKRFQRCQSANVEVFKTRKKGWGLRAGEDLPANSFIMEYVGEVVRPKEFRSRVKMYSKQKIKHHYFMALGSEEVIDATVKGNLTRFINHSCEPNCETQKWTVNGELRIGFFTIRDLKAGEEITFDYQFQRYGRKAQKCYCEAPSCRGYIGGNEQTFDLNGDNSPREKLGEERTGFKIPKLTQLQRMDIERRLREEEERERMESADVTNNSNSSTPTTNNPITTTTTSNLTNITTTNDRPGIQYKTPFATRQYHKPPIANTPISSSVATNPTNGLINPYKRRFDSLTTNNIDLTPALKISKEEHRRQFEMHVRVKDYYDTIERYYGPAAVEQLKLSQRAFYPMNGLPPPLPPIAHPSGGEALGLNGTINGQRYPTNPSSTLIVLANDSIQPVYAIDDELAFSLCDYDNYFEGSRNTTITVDSLDETNPYPGSYYETPSGETWFATVILDRKTHQPRSVILKLKDLKRKSRP